MMSTPLSAYRYGFLSLSCRAEILLALPACRPSRPPEDYNELLCWNPSKRVVEEEDEEKEEHLERSVPPRRFSRSEIVARHNDEITKLVICERRFLDYKIKNRYIYGFRINYRNAVGRTRRELKDRRRWTR